VVAVSLKKKNPDGETGDGRGSTRGAAPAARRARAARVHAAVDPPAPAALFFFFQAEDGIRDRDVTGVQTCALPI